MNEIQPFITSIDSIPTAHPSDHLGSILDHVSSSTDPIFIFNDKNEFCGVISPSYVLFKRRFPAGTKVQTAMIMTPHITKNSRIYEVASHMLATQVYTLPVFEGIDIIEGVVRGKDLIQSLLKNPDLLAQVSAMIEITKPLTATMHMSVGEAYSTIKKEKSSRIVVVSKSGILEGIITRRDLQSAFLAPADRHRSGKNKGTAVRSTNFEEEELKRFDFPISEFYNTDVKTVEKGAKLKEIIACMVEHKVNSIVLVDRINKPVGIVSVRSILTALTKVSPAPQIPIELSDKNKLFIDGEREKVMEILSKFAIKESKRVPIKGLEYIIEAAKNPKGKVIAYEPSLFVQFTNGEKYGTKVSNKNLYAATKEAVKKIAAQEEAVKSRHEH